MTDKEALMAVANALAQRLTAQQQPAQVTEHNDAVTVADLNDNLIELRSDGMLVVQIHYSGPEPGDVHEMRFDFSSAVHAPAETAETIARAVFFDGPRN